jgi:hypothetical protein
MPIRQDDNQPNRRFGIINLVLIGFGVLLLVSSFIPSNGMQQVPRVPYSLFIDQVNDGACETGVHHARSNSLRVVGTRGGNTSCVGNNANFRYGSTPTPRSEGS